MQYSEVTRNIEDVNSQPAGDSRYKSLNTYMANSQINLL